MIAGDPMWFTAISWYVHELTVEGALCCATVPPQLQHQQTVNACQLVQQQSGATHEQNMQSSQQLQQL
jgi:hypothetical protein